MSSDVVLYTTLAAAAAAATAVTAWTLSGKDGEDPIAECEYDPSTEKAVCDMSSNTLSYVQVGKPTNDASCPAESVVQSTTPCDDNGSSLDCLTTPWSDWSTCDCLLKQSTRTRTITRQASVGGAVCGPLVETQDCSSSCGLPLPPEAPDCTLEPQCTPDNPCSPLLDAEGKWQCKFRCDQNRTVACNPLHEEEVCGVPSGLFGQFSCDAVCDLSQKPDCVKPGCCKNADGCIVKIEAANGLSQSVTVARGEWYCEDPCANQTDLTCGETEEAACVLGDAGHLLQCLSKCRTLTRPVIEFAQDLTCKVDASGTPSWEVSSMCAGKPVPVCSNQTRTASTPQCVLTDAALAKPVGSAYTPADFDWKCISPCGNEPPCATVPGITPMVCAQDPVNGTYQWTGTCIRNVDVEKCGLYLCSSNETAYCTTSSGWTACVDSSCKANPDPDYGCPGPGADTDLIDYKEVCDPVTKVVICKPQCKPQPPASMIGLYDPKTQYPFCSADTGFRYEVRNYGETMCSAAKPGADFRCVPNDNGWTWVPDNEYMANRWQYVDYIQRQAVFAPYKREAVNADNPSGPKVTVLCQDVECKAPISPTIGVDCIGSAVVAKALEGALGNPIGNLAKTNPAIAQVDGNLTYYPRDSSKRQYYRPDRYNFDLVCPLMGSSLPTCSSNGSFVQSSPYNQLELITAVKPYSGSLTGACSCRAGFLGPNCQYSNAGTCNNKGTVDATGKCSCLTGFAGSACQFEQVNKCGAAATSITTMADGSYSCSCPAGYYGTNSDGKSACINKDAILLSSPICSAPCGPGFVWSMPACSPSDGAGKTCSTLGLEFCSSTRVACTTPTSSYFSLKADFNGALIRIVQSTKAIVYNEAQLFFTDGASNVLYAVVRNTPTAAVEYVDTSFRIILSGNGSVALRPTLSQSDGYLVLNGRVEPFTAFTRVAASPPVISLTRAPAPGSQYVVRGGCSVAAPDGHVITGLLFLARQDSSPTPIWGYRSNPVNLLSSLPYQYPAEYSGNFGMYSTLAVSYPGAYWINAPAGSWFLPKVLFAYDQYGTMGYQFFFADGSVSSWFYQAGRTPLSSIQREVPNGFAMTRFMPLSKLAPWRTSTGTYYASTWVETDVAMDAYTSTPKLPRTNTL